MGRRCYLQLAHNERHPGTGVSTAKVIHNFGRVEQVDRAGPARLVSSISRFLDPATALAAASGLEVEVLDSRRLGGAWTLDRIWERLGIGAAIRTAASGRRLDAGVVERVVFALVVQRALEPGSKLAATRWVSERLAIEGCAGFDPDAAYAAMDFLLEALGEIAAGCSMPPPRCSTCPATSCSWTRPLPIGSSTAPTSSPSWPPTRLTTRSSAQPNKPGATSGTPRTTGPSCPGGDRDGGHR
jgi:hypothetical protein